MAHRQHDFSTCDCDPEDAWRYVWLFADAALDSQVDEWAAEEARLMAEAVEHALKVEAAWRLAAQ